MSRLFTPADYIKHADPVFRYGIRMGKFVYPDGTPMVPGSADELKAKGIQADQAAGKAEADAILHPSAGATKPVVGSSDAVGNELKQRGWFGPGVPAGSTTTQFTPSPTGPVASPPVIAPPATATPSAAPAAAPTPTSSPAPAGATPAGAGTAAPGGFMGLLAALAKLVQGGGWDEFQKTLGGMNFGGAGGKASGPPSFSYKGSGFELPTMYDANGQMAVDQGLNDKRKAFNNQLYDDQMKDYTAKRKEWDDQQAEAAAAKAKAKYDATPEGQRQNALEKKRLEDQTGKVQKTDDYYTQNSPTGGYDKVMTPQEYAQHVFRTSYKDPGGDADQRASTGIDTEMPEGQKIDKAHQLAQQVGMDLNAGVKDLRPEMAPKFEAPTVAATPAVGTPAPAVTSPVGDNKPVTAQGATKKHPFPADWAGATKFFNEHEAEIPEEAKNLFRFESVRPTFLGGKKTPLGLLPGLEPKQREALGKYFELPGDMTKLESAKGLLEDTLSDTSYLQQYLPADRDNARIKSLLKR